MLEPIHKKGILKLINFFTTAPLIDSNVNSGSGTANGANDPPLYRFKEQINVIDLPCLCRLGIIISKFEQVFKPNPLVLNGSHRTNLLYLQQISGLVHYIEVTDLFGNKNENNNGMETLQVLQASEHMQALILLIRDWILQFYQEKNIIYTLFPTINSDNITFSLLDIKENNICIWAILIFNIFYKLRDSFPKYTLVLDFSWLLFNTMQSFLDMVRIDYNYINSLLQTTLLCTRLEDEQERHLNADLYKQIETLRGKIVETKKRIQTLAITQMKMKKETHNAETFVRIANHGRAAVMCSMPSIKSKSSKRDYTFTGAVAGEKPYRCLVCTKTFPTSYKLNRHSYSHSGERPYMCTWPNCLKRFNDNYHLRRHMNTHTGDKPFPCKYPGCSKRYSRSEDLRNHQKTHYNTIGSDGTSGSITAITTNNNGEVGVSTPGPTLHLTNSDGTTLNVLVQSSNSLNSPVTYSLAPASTSISPITMSKAAIRLATEHNATDPTQLVLQSQLNQLQLQLQQHQQQVSQQQAFNALSPGIAEEALHPTIILQESPASSSNQNHVTASLHLSDYNF